MSDTNIIILEGRLVRDAEVKEFDSGNLVKFPIASNFSWPKKGTNEWMEQTTYVDCVAFGQSGDSVANAKKGQKVFVLGRLKQENWESNGEKRSKLVINVSLVGNTAASVGAGLATKAENTKGKKTTKAKSDDNGDENEDISF